MSSTSSWQKSVKNVVQRYGHKAQKRLDSYFAKSKFSGQAKNIGLIVLKKEQKMELWAQNKKNKWFHIHDYKLTAYSGKLGPKLKKNDKQIPEGVYKIVDLNPYSNYHLSLHLNYPNSYDKQHARSDRRKDLGDNIFIHGKNSSVGCIAIGNESIEEIFTLAYKIGVKKVKVIIAPNDLRKKMVATNLRAQPVWVKNLYSRIKNELRYFV